MPIWSESRIDLQGDGIVKSEGHGVKASCGNPVDFSINSRSDCIIVTGCNLEMTVEESQSPPPRRRARLLRPWLVVAASIPLAVTISGLVAAICSGEWVRRNAASDEYTTFRTVPKRTAAIVPGASVRATGQPSAVLLDRLETARQLYLRGKVQRILVSGDNRTRYYNEPQAMRRWLVEHGIPDRHIYADYAGQRTFDTMARAARVFRVEDAIVCTQTFHLHRSVFLARRAGINAIGMVSDRRHYSRTFGDRVREYAARTLAFADTFVLRTEPRHLGPAIPIDGPPQHLPEE